MKKNRTIVTKIKNALMAGEKLVKADYEMKKTRGKQPKDLYSFNKTPN